MARGRQGRITASARRHAILDIAWRVGLLGKAADGGVEVAASPGAGLLDNPREIRSGPIGVAQSVLLQRDAKGDRGAVRAKDRLALLPEGGAAARPFGKPLVRDPDELGSNS